MSKALAQQEQGLSAMRFLVFITVICISLFATASFAQGSLAESDKERVFQLVAEGRDAQVVESVSGYAWLASSDIELLAAYCESQFILFPERPTCQLSEQSASQAKRFAKALWDGWLGRVKAARNELRNLLAYPDWQLWGKAGLAELARHTEHHADLATIVSSLSEDSRASAQGARLYERYSFMLVEETADWVALGELLNQYSAAEVLESPKLFYGKAHLLFLDGHEASVRELLSNASPAVQRTLFYALVKAEYSTLHDGVSWGQAIRSVSPRYPENRRLILETAFHDLFSESQETVKAALATIHAIAESSSRDVRQLLDMATMLALYRKPEDSERVYRLIDVDQADLQEFAAFHVLVAWNAVYRGDYQLATRSLESALRMAPSQTSANWLKALIAKREEDPVSGCQALSALMQRDPRNENFISLTKHFSERFDSDCWSELANKIRQ